MHFYRKMHVFFWFSIDIFFSIYHPKIMNENKSVFVLDTQPIDGRKERKTHAQDVIREELNTVNAKIVSYGKLKSTVGLSIFHAWENFTSYFTLSRPSSFMTILCKSPQNHQSYTYSTLLWPIHFLVLILQHSTPSLCLLFPLYN